MRIRKEYSRKFERLGWRKGKSHWTDYSWRIRSKP